MPAKKTTKAQREERIATEAKEEVKRRLETAYARAAVAEEEEKEVQERLIAEQLRTEVTENQATQKAQEKTVTEENPTESNEYDLDAETQTPPSEINVDSTEIILRDIQSANNAIEKLFMIAESLPEDCVDTRVYAELIKKIALTNVDEAMLIYGKAETKGIIDTLILSTAIEMLIRTQQIPSAIELYNYGNDQYLLNEDTCFRVMNAIATHYGPEETGLFYAEAIPAAIKASSSRIHEAILSMVFKQHDKANAHFLTLANIAHTNLMATNLPINHDAVHAWMFRIALAYSHLFAYTDAIYEVVKNAPGGRGPLTQKAYQDCLTERANIQQRPQLMQSMQRLYDLQDNKREEKKAFIQRIMPATQTHAPVSVQQPTTRQRTAMPPARPQAALQSPPPAQERKFQQTTSSNYYPGMYPPSQPGTQQPSRDFLQYLSGAQQTTAPRHSFGRGRGRGQ